jgi:hypothetical protein
VTGKTSGHTVGLAVALAAIALFMLCALLGYLGG